VLRYQELLSDLRARSGLEDPERVRAGAEIALEAVAGWLDAPERQRLADTLPSRLGSLVLASGHAPGGGVDELLREVAAAMAAPPERALYLVQALLSALADEQPEAGELVRRRVPPDVADLFNPPDQGPRRERASRS
jgi:uncharacterized protein (DUF2267 family)